MIPLQRSSFTLSTPNGPLQTIFRDTQQFGRVVDIFRHPQSGENFVVTLRQDSIALLMDQQLQEQTFAALTEDTARYERATDAEVYYWGVGQYFEGLGVTMASYQGKPAKRASAAHDNTVLQAAGPDSRIVGLHTKADLPITTGEPWMVMHNEPAKTASPAGMPVALGGQGRTWAKYLDPQAGETTIRSYFSRERFI